MVYFMLNLGDRLEVVPYAEFLMMVLSLRRPAIRFSLVVPIGMVMFSSMYAATLFMNGTSQYLYSQKSPTVVMVSLYFPMPKFPSADQSTPALILLLMFPNLRAQLALSFRL